MTTETMVLPRPSMLESFDGSSSFAFDGGPQSARGVRARSSTVGHHPFDWPGPGPIDLEVHDLPHRSSTTEWWYVKSHLQAADGRSFSVFAAFFRVISGVDEASGEPTYAHSLTWAIADPQTGRYITESRVDPDAPRMGIERIDRGEGTPDPRLRRAMREVCAKGQVPYPDRLFSAAPHVGQRRLELEFEQACLRKDDDGCYHLELRHPDHPIGCALSFRPCKDPVRHGDDGVVKGTAGEDMFYYFIPRCEVAGEVLVDGHRLPAAGQGWYDHEFGRHPEGAAGATRQREDMAWNWCGLQLDDGTEISAYTIFDLATDRVTGQRLLVIDTRGRRTEYLDCSFEACNSWRSTRSFNEYPTRWHLRCAEADIDLSIVASFDDQEFVTVISKPAFWEGRVDVRGTSGGHPVRGLGFVERNGFGAVEDLETFFGAVGKEVRRSVRDLYPLSPTWEQARDLIATESRPELMQGVDVDRFAEALIAPVREITDRGGKSWRSYAALACCDIVGGDSREFVQWLAMPEFMHVGSLIVDDVQDKSEVRRGGPCCHQIHGEAHAINAGTAAYFMGQKLLKSDSLSSADQLRLYDLYFQALRAGHAGQALDIEGLDHAMPEVVRTGDGADLEERILAIHRLKTAAPAAALARMGAVAGGGSEAQIDGVGRFFEGLGLAFQIIDDVLNLRGFRAGLKSKGEDITHGKVTLPVAKAMTRLGVEQRRWLWSTIESKPTDPETIAACIECIEGCGALQACVDQAEALVEDAWATFDPLVEDSLPKLILRAFGWYVLQRHY